MSKVNKLRLLCILLLASCSQINLNGIVHGYRIEAVATYQQYSAYMTWDHNVRFDWVTVDTRVNSASERVYGGLTCLYTYPATEARQGRQNCVRTFYLVVTWQNNERWCKVNKQMWDTVELGNVVRVQALATGVLKCGD